MNTETEKQKAMRLIKIEQKKKHEDAIRQKAFDRGYREGYSAGVLSVQPEGEEES